MGQISLHSCDQIRELCSASLDGELSELDDARVNAHLAACRACRGFAATASQAARLVRSTPLDDLDVRIVMPSSRLAVARKLQVAAAAAAMVSIVGLSAVVGSVGSSSSPARPARAGSSQLRFPDQELRLLERASRPRSHTRLALYGADSRRRRRGGAGVARSSAWVRARESSPTWLARHAVRGPQRPPLAAA